MTNGTKGEEIVQRELPDLNIPEAIELFDDTFGLLAALSARLKLGNTRDALGRGQGNDRHGDPPQDSLKSLELA
tara:strand:- start:137 stop:358 length:222 start_codon:yes stop_codon:yes gene_type:complete